MRLRQAPGAMPKPGRARDLRRWWLNRSVRSKGLVVVAGPLIALLVITSASLALQYYEQQVRSIALASSDLDKAALQVLADAVNAETGVRGYAATGDPFFLVPYELALTRIGADRKSLRKAAIAEGDSRQQHGDRRDHSDGVRGTRAATLRHRRRRPRQRLRPALIHAGRRPWTCCAARQPAWPLARPP